MTRSIELIAAHIALQTKATVVPTRDHRLDRRFTIAGFSFGANGQF